jgi:ribosomal protein S18 acetylase RimI-like enzyme
MERDCFPTEAFSRKLIKNLLTNPKSIIIKATIPSGRTIGNIIGITKKEENLPVGWIFSLCVLVEHRKKGIATHLVQLLEEEFYLNGIKKIKLEVSACNNVAQLFYKRHGYLTTNIILPNFYKDGSNAIVMSKNL